VTPGGKALEAPDELREAVRRMLDAADVTDGGMTVPEKEFYAVTDLLPDPDHPMWRPS
jgi:hypothetical protein